MIDADETFDGTFPFEPHFSEAPGFRMHYVDEGEGEPIICLHGEPTWSYLYRNFIPRLSERNRVIVPDHMGFGKSETPQDREYVLKTHVENLAALIEELDLRNITFVGQDWGGPMATQYIVRHPDRVKRVFFMNTLTGYGPRTGELLQSRWFKWVAAGYENGQMQAVLSDLKTTILSIMRLMGGVHHNEVITTTWERAYQAPFPTVEECKAAIEFPLDVLLGRIRDYAVEGAAGLDHLRAKPAMLAEGMRDQAIPPAVALSDFQQMWPDRPVVKLDNAGHFCQEDAPETLVALIQAFLQTT